MPRYTTTEIVSALKKTQGMVYLAAKRLGCDPQTIASRAKREASIASLIKSLRGEVIDVAESNLFGAIKKKEPWAIAMCLRTIGKDRGYFEKNELDINEAKKLTIIEEVIEPGQGNDSDQTLPGAS